MTQAPAPARATLTRDDLVALARQNRPWNFLPLAAQALAIAPHDHGLRFLAAAGLARLGLRTLASELLDSLPDAVAVHPDIRALRNALTALPSDALRPEARLHTLRANLDACPALAQELRDALDAWTARNGGIECYRTLDGNILRRAADAPRGDLRVLAWLLDARTQAAATAATLRRADRAYIDPVVVEGLDPPWTLLEAWRTTAPDTNGHTPRLWVLQSDPAEALDALSVADLREVLADPRVTVLVGPDASERLGRTLAACPGTILPWIYLTNPCVRRRVQPAPGEVLEAAHAAQGRVLETLNARVQAKTAGRDRAYWARRYTRALAGGGGESGGEPLRVLIPISRHSTFVKHAAADLRDALTVAGCKCEILTEPDAHARLSAIAYAEALDRLDPDLIVLANYTRSSLGEVIPPNLPFVTWVQDAMPHLLDERVGRTLGEFDHVAGHLLPELFAHFGYPPARTLPFPVAASESKFHPGHVDPAAAARLACDIAFVTHHSETPEAMLARLLAHASGPRRATLERVAERTRRVVLDAALAPSARDVQAIVAEELAREHASNGPAEAAGVARVFALPYADRLLRHQTLAWAADLCERRGWRLHLYGSGWSSHPRFGAFAKGPLEHDADLRAAYHAAGVTIHASITTLLHQRVLECALSGGLPLCRLLRDDLEDLRFRAASEASRREEPTVGCVATRLHGHRVADHPACEAYARACAGLGLPAEEFCWVSDRRRAIYLSRDVVPPLETTAHWLLGDLGEGAFRTPEGLERLVERAMTDAAWRAARSATIAERTRARYTHAVFAKNLLAFVARSLGA